MEQDQRIDTEVDFGDLLVDPVVAGAYEDAEAREELVCALVQARKESGLRQQEVADSMATTQSTISDFEQGTTDPHLSTVQRYSRAIGIKVAITVEERAGA